MRIVSVRTLIAMLAILSVCSSAQAQKKPFKVTGGGTALEGLSFVVESNYSAKGNATHLGKYTGNEGYVQALSLNPETGEGTFAGGFTFVAANGDKLEFTHGTLESPATFTLIPLGEGYFSAVFVAEFIPVSGTGRFNDVTDGSFIMVAVTEPFTLVDAVTTSAFDFEWEGEGWIEFGKK